MTELEKIEQQIERSRKKEMQLKHQLVRAENTLSYMQKKTKNRERSARTHRLANKGGTVEHFFPETKEMSEEEFFSLMLSLTEIEEVRSHFLEQISLITGGRRQGG